MRASLLTRGEDYTITLPYAHCKGLILGTLTMEMGGQVRESRGLSVHEACLVTGINHM